MKQLTIDTKVQFSTPFLKSIDALPAAGYIRDTGIVVALGSGVSVRWQSDQNITNVSNPRNLRIAK